MSDAVPGSDASMHWRDFTGQFGSFGSPLQSRLPGVVWPAVPGQHGLLLAALLTQLEQSQWWPTAAIEQAQMRQLRVLIEHAQRHSRFHAERLAEFRPDQAQGLREWLSTIPVMRRADLQSHRADIDCKWLPPEHGEVLLVNSTGSTGEPVAVRRSGLNGLIWMAMTLREHLWQRRDFSRPLAVIRAQLAVEDTARRGVTSVDWGAPVNHLFASGPSYGLNLQTDIARQAEWLRQIMPTYLLTYPSNLAALLDLAEADPEQRAGLGRLKQVRTISETLNNSLRERCQRVLGVGIADLYSTQEVGVIAIECPQGGGYHVMSEGFVVELLRDDGLPCVEGESGRVVVTDLHNFATPLIRYDLGDLAEADGPCSCGRGLPKIRRILGRERNQLRLPDGRRVWPASGLRRFSEVPVRQYQLIQLTLEKLEVRLHVARPLSTEERYAIAEHVRQSLGHPFEIDVVDFSAPLPLGPGGKFEQFVSRVA